MNQMQQSSGSSQNPGRSKSLRGLASADPATRKAVARKGGRAVSQNRQHMAEIGRKGGEVVSRDRNHMASIGRKGGEASQAARQHGHQPEQTSRENLTQ